MNELELTLAIHDYDHTRDLVTGLVPTPGIRLRPLALTSPASRFKTADVFVAIFGIMVVAVTIQWLMSRLETRLTPWRRGAEDGH